MEVPADERDRYKAYVEQLRNAERELEHVQQRASALRKMVEAYSELYPDLTAVNETRSTASDDATQGQERVATQPKQLRGKRAVAQIVSEADELLTVGEILARLEERGTAPASEEALRTTLNRMFKNDGTLDKGDKGGRLAYRWKD